MIQRPAIEFKNVSKRFVLQHDRPRSFQEMMISLWRRNGNTAREEFWALKDVNFAVAPGEMLGIIGSNGSGKSTALKLMSRLLQPTEGQVVVNGKVSALLELGAGFHPDLTGLENIYLNGSILGFDRVAIDSMKDAIIKFAELERFIDTPLKHYSSGMIVRLGFAIAINVDPDVLLVDEVLAVGDEAFQTKCVKHIEDLRCRGKTIVFVSHGLTMVEELCDRVVWLNRGVLETEGAPSKVIATYLEHVHAEQRAKMAAEEAECAAQEDALPPKEQVQSEYLLLPQPARTGSARRQRLCQLKTEMIARLRATGLATSLATTETMPMPEPSRWGSREIAVTAVHFISPSVNLKMMPQEEEVVKLRGGERLTLQIHYRAQRAIKRGDDVVFGIAIYRADGIVCYGTNTDVEQLETPAFQGAGVLNIEFANFAFLRGLYTIDIAIHSRDLQQIYDYHRPYCRVAIHADGNRIGIYQPQHTWKFLQGVQKGL